MNSYCEVIYWFEQWRNWCYFFRMKDHKDVSIQDQESAAVANMKFETWAAIEKVAAMRKE